MILRASQGSRDFKKKPIPITYRKNWEVYGVHEGRFGLLLESEDGPLYNRGPTVWILPPNIAHGKIGDGSKCQISFFVTDQMPALIEQICQKDGWMEIPLVSWQSENYLEKFEALVQASKSTDVLQPIRIQMIFHQLLMILLESLPRNRLPHLKNQNQIRLEPAFLWFRDHMEEQPDLEEIARTVHMSESHFRKLVREQYSKSSKTILMEIRMERATGLLQMDGLSMEDIAKTCGFSSHAAFSRAFKRHQHCTPHEWRMGKGIQLHSPRMESGQGD